MGMKYRTLGRTGLQVSEVSLGTEYLIGKPHAHIVEVVQAAIEAGINYFDLFCAAPAFRDAMGEAFAGRRDRVILAQHLGATVTADGQYKKTRAVSTSERFFEDMLTRYDTDHADVLFLHNCDSQKDFDTVFREKGFLGLALRLKAEGKAHFLGFSGHTVETARQAVESGVIDALMFPINLSGHAVPGKIELLRLCAARGVGVIAMKPYGGGKLLQDPATMNLSRYARGGKTQKMRMATRITPVRCLAYALAQIGVAAAVPGCANLEELEAALAYHSADAAARDYAEILKGFEQYTTGACAYCNHCLPCPSNIDIGQTLRLLDLAAGGVTPALQAAYDAMPAPTGACIVCGACESRCPFEVPTVSRIAEAATRFGA